MNLKFFRVKTYGWILNFFLFGFMVFNLSACGRTLLGTLLGGGIGLAAGGAGGYFLSKNFCYGCSMGSSLDDGTYGAIIGGSSGLTLFAVGGALIGNYYDDQIRIEEGEKLGQKDRREDDLEIKTQSLYFSACRLGDEKVIHKILQTHPDYVGLIDVNGKTGLHWAVEMGKDDTAKFLVYEGTELNHQDHLGKTALHYAIEKNRVRISEFLINEGADLELVDHNNKLAMDYLEQPNLLKKKSLK